MKIRTAPDGNDKVKITLELEPHEIPRLRRLMLTDQYSTEQARKALGKMSGIIRHPDGDIIVTSLSALAQCFCYYDDRKEGK